MAYTRQIGSGASYDRMEKLISERLKEGANKKDIDNRMCDLHAKINQGV